VIRLTVFIVRAVPAGMVAAFERGITNEAQKRTVSAINFFEVIWQITAPVITSDGSLRVNADLPNKSGVILLIVPAHSTR
jgi:hypothetical protein